jgi:hypothetical protein
MSWLFSQALVAEYSAASCSAGAPSAPSNTTPTPQAFLSRDKTTDAWNRFPSGMTCEPLTESRGEELLKSFLVASHAPTSVPPARAQELKASSQDCGPKWRALSVKFDRALSSWKTAHCLLSEDLPWFSVTLPKWGMMRAGELWERTMLALPISGTGAGLWHTPRANECSERSETFVKRNADRGAHCFSGLSAQVRAFPRMWPTPTGIDNPQVRGVGKAAKHPKRGTTLGGAVRMWPTPTVQDSKNNGAPSQMERNTKPLNAEVGGALNPDWTEWLMGWPIGFTASDALATDKFQQWLRSHGVFLVAQAMTEEAA